MSTYSAERYHCIDAGSPCIGCTVLSGQKIVVVMPAYNAAKTLRKTYDEVMAQGIVDLIILVDDASTDETVAIARTLDHVQVEVHPSNRGYGGETKRRVIAWRWPRARTSSS